MAGSPTRNPTTTPAAEDLKVGFYIDPVFLKPHFDESGNFHRSTFDVESDSLPVSFPLPPMRLSSQECKELLQHGFLAHNLPPKLLELADEAFCKGYHVGHNGRRKLIFLKEEPSTRTIPIWIPRIMGMTEKKTLDFIREEGDRTKQLATEGKAGAVQYTVLAAKYKALERELSARGKKVREYYEQDGEQESEQDDGQSGGRDGRKEGRENNNGGKQGHKENGKEDTGPGNPNIQPNSQLYQLLGRSNDALIKACIMAIDTDLPFMAQWACSRLIRSSIIRARNSHSKANQARNNALSTAPVPSRMNIYKHVMEPQKYDADLENGLGDARVFSKWRLPNFLQYHAYKAYRRVQEEGIHAHPSSAEDSDKITATLDRAAEEHRAKGTVERIREEMADLKDGMITVERFKKEFPDGGPWNRAPQVSTPGLSNRDGKRLAPDTEDRPGKVQKLEEP
ncbi:hypothetical protein Hte_005852 [Hypoxylon texense]